MNLVKIAFELKKVTTGVSAVYIRCNPEVLDFTDKTFQSTVTIASEKGETFLSLNPRTLMFLCGILQEAVFREGLITFGWNIKNFFSYAKFYNNVDYNFESNIMDLKILESYFGERDKKAPVNYRESMVRFKSLMKMKNWPKAKELNKKVYVPLITKVLPDIETLGLGHVEKRDILYSYYELEGQINGRMSSSAAYDRSFLPHTMDDDAKKNLRSTRKYGDVFMYFDFYHMEVNMLQWLSKDERLKKILDSDEDFYQVLFKLITKYDCDNENKRNIAKAMFLPVVYGQSSKSLAKKLNLSEKVAEGITDRLHAFFPHVFEWVRSHQPDDDGYCYDFFGRKRMFEEESFYKVRNFVVQSPASFVCLEKLIRLQEEMSSYGKIACHIHDGYVIVTDPQIYKTVKILVTNVLEEPSALCPGLELKVNCKMGDSLYDLQEV